MNRFFYLSGSLYHAASGVVETAFRSLFPEIKDNAPLIGHGYTYSSEEIAFSIETASGRGATWSLGFEFSGSEEEWTEYLDNISKKLIEADILYSLGHMETDAEREEIGDEELLEHPKFVARYVPTAGKDLV